MRSANGQIVVGLLVAVLCIAATPVAEAADPARWLPEDTAIYLGWSCTAPEENARTAGERRLQQAIGRFVRSDASSPDEAAWVGSLLSAIAALRYEPAAVGIIDLELSGHAPRPQAALVTTAKAGEKLAEALMALPFARESTQRTVRGTALNAAEAEEGLIFLWGVHKEHFVLAVGERTAERVLACLDGDGPTLADNAEVQATRKKVQPSHDGEFFDAFVHVDRIRTRALELVAQETGGAAPPEVERWLDELGLKQFKSKYLHFNNGGDRPELRAFAHVDTSGPRKGIWKFWSQEALTPADLQLIPKDAYWAYGGNLDLYALWTEVERVLGAAAPDALPPVRGGLAAASTMLGFSITTDLLPALGDTWIVMDAPTHGGFLGSGTVLIAEVRDPVAAPKEMLDIIVQVIRQATLGEDDFELKHLQTRDGDRVIDYVLLAGLPIPVAPAWTIVENRLVLALHPQTVAAAARQVDSATRKESLLDHPEWRAAVGRLPSKRVGVFYVNSQSLARAVYPLVTWASTAIVAVAGRHGAEIDLAVWPVLADAFPDLTNFVLAAAEDPEGVVVVGSGSGMPVLIGVGAGVGASAAVLVPSVAAGRQSAQRAVSAANLRGIGMACHIYANDHDDKFPESFDVLVQEGLITRKQLRSPLERQDREVSYVLVPLPDANTDPRNVLAYEAIWNTEGLNALFADGHVEFLPLWDFAPLLRDTYRRLGREEDIPGELRIFLSE